MAMYFPMVSKNALTPSNSSYAALVAAIDDFRSAQDDYWDSRKAYWETQGIVRSRSSIVDRYERKVGIGDPWTWPNVFSNLDPSRAIDFRNQHYVFVDSSYPGREELYELDDDGNLQRLVPRQYAAQMQNGNPEEDVLFTTIDKFNGKGNASSYYIDFGGTPLAVDVFSKYDEAALCLCCCPWLRPASSLQLMNLIGDGWFDNCNTERLAYQSAFSAYNLQIKVAGMTRTISAETQTGLGMVMKAIPVTPICALMTYLSHYAEKLGEMHNV